MERDIFHCTNQMQILASLFEGINAGKYLPCLSINGGSEDRAKYCISHRRLSVNIFHRRISIYAYENLFRQIGTSVARRTLKVYKLPKSIFVRGYYRLHIPLIRSPFLSNLERIIRETCIYIYIPLFISFVSPLDR